jgi:hypothetical protein
MVAWDYSTHDQARSRTSSTVSRFGFAFYLSETNWTQCTPTRWATVWASAEGQPGPAS